MTEIQHIINLCIKQKKDIEMLWKLIHEQQDDNEHLTNQIKDIQSEINHLIEEKEKLNHHLLNQEEQITDINRRIDITNKIQSNQLKREQKQILNTLSKQRSNHT